MRTLLLALLLAVSVGAALATGYRTGRGGLSLPDWVPTQLSSALGVAPPATPGSASDAPSDLKDYEFSLRNAEAKQGDAIIAVELVHKPTAKPVPDAVIFATRIDMAPDGMPTMTAPLELVPGGEPGVYWLKTNLAMEGGWQLSLAAKVQGEPGTVQGRLVLKAK